jgi:hypothetical protein
MRDLYSELPSRSPEPSSPLPTSGAMRGTRRMSHWLLLAAALWFGGQAVVFLLASATRAAAARPADSRFFLVLGLCGAATGAGGFLAFFNRCSRPWPLLAALLLIQPGVGWLAAFVGGRPMSHGSALASTLAALVFVVVALPRRTEAARPSEHGGA